MRLTPATQLIGVVVAAILLWLVVMAFSYHSFSVAVPLKVIGLASGLAIEQNLTHVDVTIRSQTLRSYRLRHPAILQASVDVSDITTLGTYSVPVTVNITEDTAWIADYRPNIVTLDIVPATQAVVPLVANIVGFPGSGYAIGGITITPPEATIFGPASTLSGLSAAFVEISAQNRRSAFTATTSPIVRDADGQVLANVFFSPATVQVAVAINAGDSFKTVGLQPQFRGELPPGNWIESVSFDAPALTIRGDAAKLAEITRLLTTPISLTGQTTSFTDKVALEIPAGVELLEANLVNVHVAVGLSTNNRRLVLLPSYTNITSGLSVTSLAPPTVSVTLAGPPDVLDTLNRANTLLDLDLRGKLSGANVIKLSSEMFTTPDSVKVISFSPAELEVTLTKAE